MPSTRVVSLLPSATDLVCELGAAGALRGVTHECDLPAGLPPVPRVVSPALDLSGMGGAEIDEAVRSARRAGRELFALDEDALRRAAPDLIICQDTCEACAPHAAQARRAVEVLGGSADVLSIDPRGIGGILDSVTAVAARLGRDEEGRRLRASLESRLRAAGAASASAAAAAGAQRPRVLALEWIDPPYTAGHWVPEMVEAAGGANLVSSAGEHSRPMSVAEAAGSGPDVAVVMPCGFDAARAASEYSAPGSPLAADRRWLDTPAARSGRVYAVDAGGYFSRPSIRAVAGVEILASLLWPCARGLPPPPAGSYVRLGAGAATAAAAAAPAAAAPARGYLPSRSPSASSPSSSEDLRLGRMGM